MTAPTPPEVLDRQIGEDRWERERELRHFARANVDWPDVRDLPDASYGQGDEWDDHMVPR